MPKISYLNTFIKRKRSFLSVGLDPDLERLPAHLPKNVEGVRIFLNKIIEHTHPFAISYKLNFGFYEALGSKGWDLMAEIAQNMPKDVFVIADAKRGDIGNTAKMYAKSIFGDMNFDAATLSSYMGRDSVAPFLEYEDKVCILLALTSNQGSSDFQFKKITSGRFLYEDIIKTTLEWDDSERFMYVVGATHPKILSRIRSWAPSNYFLVPGIGAQGGRIEDVLEASMQNQIGLIVNSSRGIIYASDGEDFTIAAGAQAKILQRAMQTILSENGLI